MNWFHYMHLKSQRFAVHRCFTDMTSHPYYPESNKQAEKYARAVKQHLVYSVQRDLYILGHSKPGGYNLWAGCSPQDCIIQSKGLPRYPEIWKQGE